MSAPVVVRIPNPGPHTQVCPYRTRSRLRLKVGAEGIAVTTPSAPTRMANVSLMDSRKNRFIERGARIADEHPEHGEARGVSGEDGAVHDQRRLGQQRHRVGVIAHAM